MRLAPLALCLLVLTACAPGLHARPARAVPLDLAGPAPDIVLLSVSGRCGPPCLSPRDNWDYLSSRGTLDAVADRLAQGGARVQVAGYASHPARTYTSPYVAQPQRGYAALLADAEAVAATWGRAPRPPRVVLLGHSHGVAWTHLLTRRLPALRVALQIDLDGVCAAWSSDYRAALRALPPESAGEPRAADACGTIRVAGRNASLKDVVWPNVERALEVQSKRLPARTGGGGGLAVNYLWDVAGNVRPDGSARGLERFVSTREDHGAVTLPRSDALKWVGEKLGPILADWQAQDAQPSQESQEAPAPPAP